MSRFAFQLFTDTFSNAHTESILRALLQHVFPAAGNDTLELLNLLIHKCAHLTEYFVFGLLLLPAFRGGRRGWKLRWAILALSIAGVYGGLDEFHQSFVPSRTTSPRDALLDAWGAAIGQIAAWRLLTRSAEPGADRESAPGA